MVPAHDQGDQRVAVCPLDDKGLHRVRGRCVEQRAKLLNRPYTWGRDPFAGQVGVRRDAWRRNGFGQLDIGSIVTCITESDFIFARFCEDMELVGCRASNRAGVSQHRAKVEAEAAEDARIGRVHVGVGLLQAVQ